MKVKIGTTEAPVEDLKKWVAALRSGNFEQGDGRLESNGKYCCLGLACILFIPKEKRRVRSFGSLMGGYPMEQPFAPDWLKDINDDFGSKHKRSYTLSTLNDDGMSFEGIADLIETEYIPEELR